MRRRAALRALACGALGLCSPRLTPRIRAAEAPAVPLDEVRDLARRIRTTPRDAILALAASARRNGADTTTLLGAVFLAGLHDIKPWHVGGKLHAVMVVESTFAIAARLPEREAWLAALWNLDDFKRSQARDVEDGDWVLPPRPAAGAASEAAARTEFLAAMTAWDHERADRAIVALLPFHDRGSLFELLWPLGARSFSSIGHKIIYTSQIERTLRRIDWAYAEPAVRSLVMGLLFQPAERQTAAYERSVVVARGLPESWARGREDAAQSAGVLRALRGAAWRDAQDLVAAALTDGVGPATIWDGLRLRAAEVFSHRTGSDPGTREALLPVHAVTVVNALGHAARTSRDDATQRLMLVQAAAWLAQLDAWLVEHVGVAERRPTIDAPPAAGVDPPAGLAALFEQPSQERARAYLAGDAGRAEHYVTTLQRHLAHRAIEHHQPKYAVAFAEEAALADPRWRAPILATALPYLPVTNEPPSEFARRALASLA